MGEHSDKSEERLEAELTELRGLYKGFPADKRSILDDCGKRWTKQTLQWAIAGRARELAKKRGQYKNEWAAAPKYCPPQNKRISKDKTQSELLRSGMLPGYYVDSTDDEDR